MILARIDAFTRRLISLKPNHPQNVKEVCKHAKTSEWTTNGVAQSCAIEHTTSSAYAGNADASGFSFTPTRNGRDGPFRIGCPTPRSLAGTHCRKNQQVRAIAKPVSPGVREPTFQPARGSGPTR